MKTLVRLTYFSTVAANTGKNSLRDILNVAERRNQDDGITGMLYVNCEHFVQILEGERDKVSQCYARIVKDTRHENPILIGCTPVDERLFGGWSMGYLGDDDVCKRVFLETTGRSYFEPNVFSEDKLIEALTSITFQIADDLIFPNQIPQVPESYGNAMFHP